MENRIRILATTDLHGYIYSHRYSDGVSVNQGTARLKTAIDRFRDKNTILVDNGDTLQGSSLQFWHFMNQADEVAPITISMNALEYDYINVGNHDFDFGEDALMKHLDSLDCPCLTSNVIYRGNPLGPSYAIREIAGKKLAFFGVTTHYITHWQKKKNIRHFHFKDAFQTASKTVEMIRRLEKPDYIICLYHGGFERNPETGIPNEELTGENQAYQMMKEIPGLDILITGHSHTDLCGSKFNTVYTQSKSNGESFSCIDIYTDTNVIEPRILTVDTPEDETMMELTEVAEKECQDWLDTPIAHTEMNLKVDDPMQGRLYKSQAITLMNKVIQEATGADIVATPLFNNASGFRKEITMRDLVSTYVYQNTLVVKQINGRILREYLEKDAEYWSIDQDQIIVSPKYLYPKPKHYNYDMADGIEYTITVSNDIGHRITSLTRNGEPITDDMEFTLCISNYRASGGGEFHMIRNTPTVMELQTSIVELLAIWMMNHQTISFEPIHNITVRR